MIKQQETGNKKKTDKATTNKFKQAQKYLEAHYAICNNIISNEFEYRSKKGKEAFKALNENNIYVRMQLDGVNLSLNNLMPIKNALSLITRNGYRVIGHRRPLRFTPT